MAHNVIQATDPNYNAVVADWFESFVLEMAQAIDQNNEHCYQMGVQVVGKSRAKPKNKIPRDIKMVLKWLKTGTERDFFIFYDENYCSHCEFSDIIVDFVKKRNKNDVVLEVASTFLLTSMLNTSLLGNPTPQSRVLWIHYSGEKEHFK